MTTRPGLKKLTRVASARPSRRPPPRTRATAVASPAPAAVPTSTALSVPASASRSARTGERPVRAASSASRASAAPPKNASRQLSLPQVQVGPASSMRMCPMSPAEPSAPRYTSPSSTMPHPMPVPTLTKRKLSTLRAVPECCSPSAMMLTSLSTMTGAPTAAARVSRTGNRFQPGMIGGITGAPSRWLTGPGTPTPTPWTSNAPPSARSLSSRSSACWSTTFGPWRTSDGSLTCDRSRSSPSVTATSMEVAPMSMPTKRMCSARPTRWERRPPREAASPCPATRPSSTSRSSSTATLDFESSTASPSSARDRRPPSRSSLSRRAWCAFSGRAPTRFTCTSSAPGYGWITRVLLSPTRLEAFALLREDFVHRKFKVWPSCDLRLSSMSGSSSGAVLAGVGLSLALDAGGPTERGPPDHGALDDPPERVAPGPPEQAGGQHAADRERGEESQRPARRQRGEVLGDQAGEEDHERLDRDDGRPEGPARRAHTPCLQPRLPHLTPGRCSTARGGTGSAHEEAADVGGERDRARREDAAPDESALLGAPEGDVDRVVQASGDVHAVLAEDVDGDLAELVGVDRAR